jgi:CDP-diacylglycerol--glycerol-3-phosphate 3-phosphatidyltransferase
MTVLRLPVSLAVLLAVLATAFASMLIYALRGRKRDADADAKGAQLFLGSGDFLLHWFLWAISPSVRLSLFLGWGPDFYNYAGLAWGLASGVFIALGFLGLGGWALALCGVCDILDGRLARAMGVASSYGDFIDSTFDRFVEAFVFLGFALYLRATPWGPFLAAAALAASLVVSYARARGEVLGVLCTAGLMQRGERLVVVSLACLLDGPLSAAMNRSEGALVSWMLGFIAMTSAFTAVHRTYWIAARLR